ncbi:rhodanese-like domain-containing protein [Uliginosibacterium sp. 31-16]|uniref:rhodanese-like domain-containing protein n=1 Tax=Uliginosibacterium sp. 31-16 TaxID=3068315 RepID=UPI002740038F|nr:rhodanese-like domain-containing protein [Uliginosibacterium sp. 31-16]MDP5240816.1 rhodanese-like domain-containing protein [Uliginosibacterium sp. 31-16]
MPLSTLQDAPANAANRHGLSQALSADETYAKEILVRARERAAERSLPFSGGVTPVEAWELFNQGAALIVDVRSAEERKFVGHVPETLHVAWATGTALTRNPRFARELEAKVGKEAVVLLLCRSGKRSALAAEVAAKAGFKNVFNVFEGFEGDLNDLQQRGESNGWKHWNLPWVQD